MKTSVKVAVLCVGLILLISAFTGCSNETDDADQGVYTSIEELSGKRIGIQIGAVLDKMTEDHVPDVKIYYFNSFPDTVVALKSIVTHEMQFAREISTRVFYMDEGTIYEEGTPEKIFENPKREKTMRFMRRLKELMIDITARTFDFAGAVTRIDQYCYKNRISPTNTAKLQSAFEGLCIQILLPVLEEPAIHVVIGYERAQEAVEMTVEYPGSFDPAETDKTLAYTILKADSGSIVYRTDPDGTRSTVCVRIG